MNDAIKVLLIGGTSHVGKSTLATQMAETLGWSQLSTDQLSRHPGRPWREDDSSLPTDIVEYYSDLTSEQQMNSVLEHYKQNVYPIADAVIRSHLNNSFDPCLVFEGSALLPDQVLASPYDRLASVWLTEPDETIATRIREASHFERRTMAEKRLTEAFLKRSTAMNAMITVTAARHGAPCMNFEDAVEFLSGICQ